MSVKKSLMTMLYRLERRRSRFWRAASTATSAEGVVSLGRHIVCSQEAESDARDYLTVTLDFIAEKEEAEIMNDVEMTFRRRKYEYSHWDRVITGYREAEKSQWQSKTSLSVMQRLKETPAIVVPGRSLPTLPLLHVLDLDKDGFILPHVDSTTSCGDVIAGLSLLSTSVMKLQHQNTSSRWITVLLPRRSLYIMRDVLRYEYTHEIPCGKKAAFAGKAVLRNRRVSIICRTQPHS